MVLTTESDAEIRGRFFARSACLLAEAVNFWEVHGVWFLLGLVFFPRVTVLLFSNVAGGLLFWIGFLIVPRVFVAILAAANYWESNPVLVILAFIICLTGEGGEKKVVHQTVIVRGDRD